MYQESGGNPFYLQQLVRAGRAGRVRPAAYDLGDLAVPAAVRAALEAELEALSAPARTLLAGAAVSGESFEPELAAAAAGMDEAQALDLLDELVRLDLVRPTAVPRHFRFRHPIVRHGVYQSAGPGWRLTAHARLAEVLERQGASPQVRAHHVERSARPGDVAALDLLQEAGAAAAPGPRPPPPAGTRPPCASCPTTSSSAAWACWWPPPPAWCRPGCWPTPGPPCSTRSTSSRRPWPRCGCG